MAFRSLLYFLSTLYPAVCINDVTESDHFIFPPEPPPYQQLTPTYHLNDILYLYWETSVGYTTLEYLCCSPTLCIILYAQPNITGSENGFWLYNFTLAYGTGDDCYVRIDQPARGDQLGFESEHFTVVAPSSETELWTQTGPITLANGETATNMTAPSALLPPLSLQEDGDGSGFLTECLDVAQNNMYMSKCWSELRLSEWVTEWIAGDGAYVPCASTASCMNENGKAPPWTETFLAKANWGPQRGCWYTGDTQSCTSQPFTPGRQSRGKLDDLLFARYAYVSYTIFSIWQFLDSFATAMQMAITKAALNVDSVTSVADSDQKTHHHWIIDVLVTTLGVALSLIPDVGPEASVLLKLGVKSAKGVAGAVPSAAKTVWSNGQGAQENMQLVQDDELQSLLTGDTGADVESLLNENINTTLAIVQGVELSNATNDYSTFVLFAENGRYSTNDNIRIPVDNNTISTLQTFFYIYLISTSLAQNGFYTVLIPGVNPVSIYNDPTNNCPGWAGSYCNSKTKDLGCQGQLDSYGLCSNLWFSKTHNSSYLLLKDGGTDAGQATEILKGMVDHGFATLQSFFEDAAVCELQHIFPTDQSAMYEDNLFNDSGATSLGAGFTVSPGFTYVDGQYASRGYITIDGPGFVNLSQRDDFAPDWTHPTDKLWDTNPDGTLDTRCMVQMNVSVANSWGGKKVDGWTDNRSKALHTRGLFPSRLLRWVFEKYGLPKW